MRMNRIDVVLAMCVLTASLGVASSAVASSARATQATTFETWSYPDSVGSPACTAPSEYHDGRVKDGYLVPEYFYINRNGNLVKETTTDGSGNCNTYSPANAADVRAWSKYQYMLVSAMSAGRVAKVVTNPSKWPGMNSTLVSFAKKIGFTGIEVDFEAFWSWPPTVLTDYNAYLRSLVSAAHAQGILVDVDAPAMTGPASFYNLAKTVSTGVDHITVMALDEEYDTNGGGLCPANSPLSWLKTVATYAKSQVPVSKLFISIGSYGYHAAYPCKTSTIVGNIPFSTTQTEPGYSSNPATIAARRDAGSGEIRWTKNGVQYDYIDKTALDMKLNVLTSIGITNVGVWSLGGGNPWF
ncbi:MAG TPA: glycosyl hydrolase family 18 protein [Streptosporangiaceae bacterium]|nr:glycosyl hydrolase family 18 protein [Streptosporangiaceae bacterium]